LAIIITSIEDELRKVFILSFDFNPVKAEATGQPLTPGLEHA
jgi:hypothetical protein